MNTTQPHPKPAETPRTDAETPVNIFDRNGIEYAANLVSADFARDLERELTNAKAALAAEQKRAEMLAKDAERLDWLEKTDGEVHSDMGAGDGPSTWYAYNKSGNINDTRFTCHSAPTIRQAIDAAIAASGSARAGRTET